MSDQQRYELLNKTPGYGSVEVGSDDESGDSSDGGDGFNEGAIDGETSFRFAKSGMLKTNIMTSRRIASAPASVKSPQDELKVVPSLLTDNVTLVTDENMGSCAKGNLYYAEKAFYNKSHPPEYALTVNPCIYQAILEEVYTAEAVPCGLYFCCHGGDGAHTGISQNDYVDITLAWTLLFLVFGAMGIVALLP